MFKSITQAIEDIKAGKIIILIDDENRENEGDFCMAGEFITDEKINFMVKHGGGLVCAPITRKRAVKLDLPLMIENNTEFTKCKFTISVDAKKLKTTGISASDRAVTIQTLIDEKSSKEDFNRPGHVFPLIAEDDGVLSRDGHTEAIVDLCKLANINPVGVICEIMNEDGTMARKNQLEEIAKIHNINIYTIADLIEYRLRNEKVVKREVEANLPTKYGNFKLMYYSNILDKKEHVALVMGNIQKDIPTLVRVHSECFTGDVLGSKRCDCQSQLDFAMKVIAEEGNGIIVYLRQEGRGIGLKNKLKAYNLQDDGRDTVEANLDLGFPADMRSYVLGAQILKDLSAQKIRLITNNMQKVDGLTLHGLEVVERVSVICETKENKKYLQTKKEKMNHLL